MSILPLTITLLPPGASKLDGCANRLLIWVKSHFRENLW